jgi:hypothetical protein
LIAEHFPKGPDSPAPIRSILAATSDLTVVELIAAYWHHAKSYYVKDGQPTSELTSIRCALQPVKDLYGQTLCCEFGPMALDVVRNSMIEAGITRSRINQHVGRIRRMFRWGVAKELLPVGCYQALTTLDGLRKGRTNAKEPEPITAVAWERSQISLGCELMVVVHCELMVGALLTLTSQIASFSVW